MSVLQERDTDFEGHRVHYWEGGQGRPLLMLHGSGPGASTQGNWRLVLEPLARRYHVLAADLIGFGKSDRKKTTPYFDFDLWCRQAGRMAELLGESKIGVIGHSLSGSIALHLAARDQRVAKVMTTGSMGAKFEPNADTIRVWTFPETREALRAVGEALVFDKSAITDTYLDSRMEVLHADGYPEYFRAMFAGDRRTYVDAAVLDERDLTAISADILMVHGRNDAPFPFEQTTLKLSRSLAKADVVAFGRCGHSPALEHPEKLVGLATQFFG